MQSWLKKVSAIDWLKQEGNGEFGLIGEEIDNNDHLGIAVRKGDSLKAEFDAALAKKSKKAVNWQKLKKAHFQSDTFLSLAHLLLVCRLSILAY